MTQRGTAKPNDASAHYTIFGTQNRIDPVTRELLPRLDKPSVRKANYQRIGDAVERSVAARCPMRPVKEAQ